jgi:hypothetical protein
MQDGLERKLAKLAPRREALRKEEQKSQGIAKLIRIVAKGLPKSCLATGWGWVSEKTDTQPFFLFIWENMAPRFTLRKKVVSKCLFFFENFAIM